MASYIERRLRARPHEAQDRERFEREVTLMRHSLFAFDLLLFGGIGYWIADRIGG
jgi:hypothetical protein